MDEKEKRYKLVKLWEEEELGIIIPPFLTASVFVSIFVIVYLTIYNRSEGEFSRKFRTIADGFSILSVLMLIYIIYVNVKYNSITQEAMIRKQSLDISKQTYEHIIDDLMTFYPESYELIDQLYWITGEDKQREKKKEELKIDPTKKLMVDYVFSDKIVTNIDNFLILKKYLILNHVGWVTNFYYMLTTPIIKKFYLENRDLFSTELYDLSEKFYELEPKELSEKDLKEEISKWRL